MSIPEGATILTAHEQRNEICIWAEVCPTAPLEARTFEVFGTGHDMPIDMGIERRYIGTAIINGGSYIFHVYERLD